MAITSLPDRKQVKHSASAQACGALLAGVLLAGIGVWQLTRDDASSRAPSLATVGVGATAAPADVIPPAAQLGRPATVYLLVGSAEQASAERAHVAALNAWAGPLEAVIVVAESDEAAAGMRHAVEHLTALRDAEGLPPIQLFDRRASGTVAWAPAVVTAGCGLDAQRRAC